MSISGDDSVIILMCLDHIQRSKCPNKTNRKYRDNGDVFQMAENIGKVLYM